MADKLVVDPKASALLVMDFQAAIVDNFATHREALLSRTASLLDAAREAQMMVCYVVVGFRMGYPEISPRNVSFSAVKDAGLFAAGNSGADIHPAVAPKASEIVVTKHRVGAFAGTDLDMILRANGIETLVLAGIATSGVVLSTVRHASDADYRLIVASDCCSDRDEDVQRVLVEKIFLRQAAVVTAAEIVHALGGRI